MNWLTEMHWCYFVEKQKPSIKAKRKKSQTQNPSAKAKRTFANGEL
jgi:hypothetical protein